MMFRIYNIKNPLKLISDDFRRKEDMKCHFQALLKKSISFIYSENSNSQNLCLPRDRFILEIFPKTEKFKFAKV